MVAAIPSLAILCFHLGLTIVFIADLTMIAYGNIQYMCPTMAFVGAVWMCIPAIYATDSDLGMACLTSIAPITVAVLVMADYISMPSYPWLWAILISGQVWCHAIEGSGAIAYAARGIGTMATICIIVAPCSLSLALWVCVLVCSYTIVCCMGGCAACSRLPACSR